MANIDHYDGDEMRHMCLPHIKTIHFCISIASYLHYLGASHVTYVGSGSLYNPASKVGNGLSAASRQNTHNMVSEVRSNCAIENGLPHSVH